jgi:hypothetical protein
MERPMMYVKATREADAGSDHYLLLCKIKLKLKRARKKKNNQLFNSSRRETPEVKTHFTM